MPYYVGDPCYVIPDEDWDKFCTSLFANPEFERNSHFDGGVKWGSQIIELWCNGGDGTWEFYPKIKKADTMNHNTNFCVDAGIFCVIDIEALEEHYKENPTVGWNGFEMKRTDSLIFEEKPTLYVEDGVVYINGQNDNSKQECPNCDELITEHDLEWCENGSCEGCWICFECECEDDEE